MKSLLFLLILLAGIAINGCGGTDVPTTPSTGSLPFALRIPGNRPAADYHAVSGVTTRIVATKVGDSVVESPQTLFYAQFTASPGIAPMKSVSLNTFPLDRHMTTDTLRLGRAGSSNIYGDNTWELIDSNGTKQTYLMPKIDIIDTVSPFDRRSTINSDVDLALGWRRPTLGSSALHIYWKAPDSTYEKVVADYPGLYEISRTDLRRLRGRGQVILTRYYYLPQRFKDRTLMITRIAQRTFNVEVL